MATWVVGDVQGCFSTFQLLLDRIEFRPGRDRLWFVGDLVNRGPDSLGMLRWARRHESSVVCVLGNHDLHLLAQREGVASARRRDTLAPVFAAPDAGELCDWGRGTPLPPSGGRFPPRPRRSASRMESVQHRDPRRHRPRRSRGRPGRLPERALYATGDGRPRQNGGEERGDPGGEAGARLSEAATAASVFTRLRTVDAKGKPSFDFDGVPETIPSGHRPWFEGVSLPEGLAVLFGHWAALGLMVSPRAVCLDSGCVWNGSLTALRLEDGALTIQPAAEGDCQPL